MNVLVVAAHPDDEVLGVGGTIARLTGEGADVTILILGEGATSRQSGQDQAADVEALAGQAREAGRLLGAKEVVCKGLPDNRFDTLPLLDVVKIVEEWVDRVSPETVYGHHAGDLNVDHEVAARAVLTATRPQAGSVVRDVFAFEVPSSTEWSFHRLSPPFHPNVYVDITGTLEKKIAALRTYEGEARLFPHPRSPESLRAIAARWGTVAGVTAAEAFELVRSVR